MTKSYSHTEAFAYFNTVPRNARWSWSGRSVDGRHIAVTLWQDRFEEQGRVYRSWQSDQPGEWRSRPGFVELIDNLAFARDNLDGIVHIILAKAKNPSTSPRAIEKCFPHEKLKMCVVELSEQDGTFVLNRVEPRSEEIR